MGMTETHANELQKVSRNRILDFEKALAQVPGATFGDTENLPLKHSFAPGLYIREMFLPKGTVVVGKIHRIEHPNFILRGKVVVVTESGGIETLQGPCSWISKAGIKRVVHVLEDTVWIGVYPSHETDLKKLEDEIIAPSFAVLEAPELEQKNCLVLALKKLGRNYKCLFDLPSQGYLLPFHLSLAILRQHNVKLDDLYAIKQGDVWHVDTENGISLDCFGSDVGQTVALKDSDMVGIWAATAVGGATLAYGIYKDQKGGGGNNDYQAMMAPILGTPQQPSETSQQYYERMQKGYQNQNEVYDKQIAGAQNLQLPQNVLNFGANANESLQQQGLIDQILAQGQGQGPNPAMDQLRMTTDQNARSAAGLIGSQRGIDPALATRMAAQGMGQANQQAAGQGALMSAQQQLSAQQLGGNLLSQRIGQQSQNAVAQGQAGLGLLGQRQQSQLGQEAAQQDYQNMINNMYSSANASNAGVASGNAANSAANFQGMMSGASSAAQAAAIMNSGGSSSGGVMSTLNPGSGSNGATPGYYGSVPGGPHMAHGGEVNPFQSHVLSKNGGVSSGLNEILNKHFGAEKMWSGGMSGMQRPPMMGNPGMTRAPQAPMQSAPQMPMKNTGMQRPPVSGMPMGGNPGLRRFSYGGEVDGQPQVHGDSFKNDIVPTMLSPGEVVIPRTAMTNPESAHDFLDKIIQKNDGPAYKDILKAKEHYHTQSGASGSWDAPVAQSNVIPAVATTTVPQEAPPQLPTQPEFGDFQKGYNQQVAGINQSANAQSQGQLEAQKLNENLQTQMQETQKYYADQRAKLDQDQAKLAKDYADGKIDPNHFWNKQTGVKGGMNRVLSMVGLFLGGFSQSKTGVNPAQQMLDKAITEDIDAQKANMGKQKNLMDMNYQKYGDLRLAEQATRMDMMNMFTAQLQGIAAKTNSQLVKANAQQQIGALGNSLIPIKDDIAAKQTAKKVDQVISTQPIADADIPLLNKDQQEQMVRIGPNQNLRARSVDDAKEVKDVTEAAQGVTDTLQKMLTYAQGDSPREFFDNTDKARKAKQLQRQAIAQYQFLVKAAGGRAAPPSEKAIESAGEMIPDPSDFNNTAIQHDIQSLMQQVQDIKNQSYSTRLVSYSPKNQRTNTKHEDIVP